MRFSKLAVCTLLCCCTMILVCVGSANAQTQITIGAATQAITFTGLGSSDPSQVSINLGHCAGSTCTLSGMAFGSGTASSGPASYSLTSALGSIVATLVNAATGQWSITQSAPITFDYGPGGSLLTGNLNLLSFQQSPGAKQGDFNYQESANITITGGSLAAAFGNSATVDGLITFRSTGNVMSLLGGTGSLGSHWSSGQLVPTPEPSAFVIFLLGSGMLLAGSLMKRKKVLSNVL